MPLARMLLLAVPLLIAAPLLQAGHAPDEHLYIENGRLGWWRVQPYDNLIKPGGDAVYRSRVAFDDRVVAWMKSSYDPIAGIGTIRRQNRPKYFGVYFMVWNVDPDRQWLDDQGRFKPVPEEGWAFGIQANTLPGAYEIEYFNDVSDAMYFTWPVDGYGSDDRQRRDLALKAAPASAGFITRSNETQTVFLAPGNQLPFVAVSIGEYLDMATKAFDNELAKRKARIDAQWPGADEGNRRARAEAYAYVVEEYKPYQAHIAAYRDKHRARLGEPAVLRNLQPTLIGDFSNAVDVGLDPFEIDEHQRARRAIYPVYKLTADTVERQKGPTPLWIAIWYPYARAEEGHQVHELYAA